MQLYAGQYYLTKASTPENRREFFIYGRKRVKATNGCNWIGECTKTGLVAFFKDNGEHSHEDSLNLELDYWLYMPVNANGKPDMADFVKWDKIDHSKKYTAYLAIDNGDLNTVRLVTERQVT